MNFFQKIRNLIAHQEDEVEQLKVQKSLLQKALEILESEPTDLEFDYDISLKVGRFYTHDYSLDYDIVSYLRYHIKHCLEEIVEKICRIVVSIQRLKIKLHYFKRNLRSWIRQMQNFLFKNLDDCHIILINQNLRTMDT